MNSSIALQGSMVALVTPMVAGGAVDKKSLEALVDIHITQGTNAIIAVGTTGESATLSVTEHLSVVEQVVKHADGRIPVIAGTGANSTSEAIELTAEAKALGVDACLLVVPYYNKPTQEGLYGHFKAIADAVAIPQILYNVPGRTITDLSNETALRLASHENIIGIKDATGDLERGKALIDAAPAGFSVFSGDDITAAELILLGAKANISVTANVVPAQMAELCQLALAGDATATRSLQAQLLPLHNALFTESNPIPVKWALAEMGLMQGAIRLPLTPLSKSAQAPLRAAMQGLSVLDKVS